MDSKSLDGQKKSRTAAHIVETTPIRLAGVDTHPGWHAF